MKTKITAILLGWITFGMGLASAAPWDHRPPPPSYHRPPPPHVRLEVRVQMKLRYLGYYRGPVDGRFGPGSRAALARFQRHHGLRPTGWYDSRTLRRLGL